MAARFVRDEEVVGSNPATPTENARSEAGSPLRRPASRSLSVICPRTQPSPTDTVRPGPAPSGLAPPPPCSDPQPVRLLRVTRPDVLTSARHIDLQAKTDPKRPPCRDKPSLPGGGRSLGSLPLVSWLGRTAGPWRAPCRRGRQVDRSTQPYCSSRSRAFWRSSSVKSSSYSGRRT